MSKFSENTIGSKQESEGHLFKAWEKLNHKLWKMFMLQNWKLIPIFSLKSKKSKVKKNSPVGCEKFCQIVVSQKLKNKICLEMFLYKCKKLKLVSESLLSFTKKWAEQL